MWPLKVTMYVHSQGSIYACRYHFKCLCRSCIVLFNVSFLIISLLNFAVKYWNFLTLSTVLSYTASISSLILSPFPNLCTIKFNNNNKLTSLFLPVPPRTNRSQGVSDEMFLFICSTLNQYTIFTVAIYRVDNPRVLKWVAKDLFLKPTSMKYDHFFTLNNTEF